MEDPLIGTWDIIGLLPDGQELSQPASITFDGQRPHFYDVLLCIGTCEGCGSTSGCS